MSSLRADRLQDQIYVGWRCGECGWETFDVDVMRREVHWPGMVGTELVCPACGVEGRFVDAFTEPILAALVWCRLGAGERNGRRWSHPISMFDRPLGTRSFYAAERLGLLAHDPIWRATTEGEEVLVRYGFRLTGVSA